MKYLYGEVFVKTIAIEAENDEEALALLNRSQKHNLKFIKEFEDPKYLKTTYALTWSETPDTNNAAVRNGVLDGFLRLMKEVIPMDDNKPRIIIPK